MTLNEVIELQERARNRLWDPDQAEIYLACQKEINRLSADLLTLPDIGTVDDLV